jgi:hypothetical protein
MDIYTNYAIISYFVLSYTVYNSIILYTYCKAIYYFFNIAIIKNVDSFKNIHCKNIFSLLSGLDFSI